MAQWIARARGAVRAPEVPGQEAPSRPDAVSGDLPIWQVVVLLMVHAGIGLVSRGSVLAIAYAVGVVLTAAIVVWRRPAPHWGLVAAFYVVGAEIFWRMSEGGIFHEMGKYAIAGILVLGMVRQRRWHPPLAPLAYFALLVPAILATAVEYELYTSRRLISQNASGPLLLVVAAIYCRDLRVTRSQMKQMLLAAICPLIATATYVARGIAMTDMEWGSESSYGASGGFGPNQVSAMLGLGAYAALGAILLSVGVVRRLLLAAVILWFTAQAALTFSRTGIYLLGLATVATFALVMRHRAEMARFLMVAVVAGVCATLVVYPALDELTGGRLKERFAEKQLSNRSEIAEADLEIWEENWVLGTGIGQAKFERGRFGFEGSAAHTEYTRLLAEHGVLGLIALGLLFGMVILRFLRSQGLGRAFSAGFATWSLAFMSVSGMRLAAPSVLLALCYAQLCAPRAAARQAARTTTPLRRLPSGANSVATRS